MTVTEDDAIDVLPATSVALAVMTLLPEERVPVVHENDPAVAIQVLPVATPPTNNWTIALASAVPVKTSAVYEVIKSLVEAELVEFESVSDAGADGSAVSST
jgi:hypothetical protein